MKLRCPACHAENSLDAFLGADAARSMIAAALAMPSAISRPLVDYLAMFRSPNRALSFDRLQKLLAELKPMIDSAMVTRGGMDRAAPLAVWQAGLEQMVELRNGNKLTLPLKSHGYLLEIVASLAEKSAAKAEADLEEGRRKGQHRAAGSNGPDAGPRRADIARSERINRVGADLSLGLIDEAAALSALRAEGLSELAVQRLAEQHRRDA